METCVNCGENMKTGWFLDRGKICIKCGEKDKKRVFERSKLHK